jgi:hypothetical protein
MSFRSAVVIGITATMAVAIAACGDDGDGAEDFIAEADQICTDAERETVGAIAEHGPIQSASDEAELLTDVVPIGEQTLESLRGLEAPDDVSSQFED